MHCTDHLRVLVAAWRWATAGHGFPLELRAQWCLLIIGARQICRHLAQMTRALTYTGSDAAPKGNQ